MKEIVDLTGRLENQLWDYRELPGLENLIPPVSIEHIATVKEDGFSVSKITCCTISGTYLEAGSHMYDNGKTLDSYPVDRFIKPVKILKIPKQGKKTLIDDEILEKNAPVINKGDALIIDTGWGEQWNKQGYISDCPHFSSKALKWVLKQKISIFGVDIPVIEAAWSDEDDVTKGNLLLEYFKSDSLLLAPLVNLKNITSSSGTLICLPLFIKGTSGAPVRAIFMGE